MNRSVGSDPLIRMPAAALASIREAVAAERDPQRAAELLRELGLALGQSYHGLFEQWLAENTDGSESSSDLDPAEFWDRFSEFFEAVGLGRLECESLHSGVLSLSSTEWAESDNPAGNHPGCQLSTGLLAEMLRRTAARDLAVLEVECRGSGADRCRFLVGSGPALDQIYREIQGGAAYSTAVASLPTA